MNIKINNVNKIDVTNHSNLVLFFKEKFIIKNLNKFFNKNEIKDFNQILKNKDPQEKIISFDLDKKKI